MRMKTTVDVCGEYFCLFSCCILVDGKNRSCIVDTQRGKLYFIPNSLYFILTKHKKRSVEWIYDQYQDHGILDTYYDFLINNELGFYTDFLENFPSINLQYDTPNLITNSIIELSDNSEYDIDKVINELSELGCEVLEIRVLSQMSFVDLSSIIDKTKESNFRSVIVGLPFSEEYTMGNVNKFLIEKYPRITQLYIYNCNISELLDNRSNSAIIYSTQKSLNAECCGNIKPNFFSPSIQMISESKRHNSCLNRKICIMENGNIKSCPSFLRPFGNIKNSSLYSVIENKEFQKIWHIKKDEIYVCKDCEMRYVCHDCRAYLKKQNDIYSQPAKCTYNPYIAKWQGEEGYISVEEYLNVNQ